MVIPQHSLTFLSKQLSSYTLTCLDSSHFKLVLKEAKVRHKLKTIKCQFFESDSHLPKDVRLELAKNPKVVLRTEPILIKQRHDSNLKVQIFSIQPDLYSLTKDSGDTVLPPELCAKSQVDPTSGSGSKLVSYKIQNSPQQINQRLKLNTSSSRGLNFNTSSRTCSRKTKIKLI